MAQVDLQGSPLPWSAAQTRAQFGAIAWLRWRILRNSLRRKGNVGDLVATVIMVPLFLAIALLPTVGSGVLAYYVVSKGEFGYVSFILWGIFVLCQLANIQLGQPGTTFDPTQLIRFPLTFRGYAVIRVFFGLISPANVITLMMSLSVALGILIAAPELWPFALTAMAAFALCNIFFTRMLFAWVDRWLSTRRAREVFTAVIFVFGMTVQYLNFHYNLGAHHDKKTKAETLARIAEAQNFYHHIEPYIAKLPPGLTSNAIEQGHLTHYGAFAAQVAGVLAFTAVFFAIFATRLYKEFRGENLSDTANAVAAKHIRKTSAIASPPVSALTTAAVEPTLSSARNTIAAVFEKEFITMRRNSGIFYALVAPLVMVVLFANLKARAFTSPDILFPAAVAYTLMGVAPLCYNALGLEGAGIQFYSLAPVSMREVFLAKNLMNIGLALAEFIAVFFAVSFVNTIPALPITLAAFFWAVFAMSLSLAIGNVRSIVAPKKVDITKMAKNQAGPMSALISIGLLLVTAGLGALMILLAKKLEQPWIVPPVMLVLAAVGIAAYFASLRNLDKLFADNRDTIAETLGKV